MVVSLGSASRQGRSNVFADWSGGACGGLAGGILVSATKRAKTAEVERCYSRKVALTVTRVGVWPHDGDKTNWVRLEARSYI